MPLRDEELSIVAVMILSNERSFCHGDTAELALSPHSELNQGRGDGGGHEDSSRYVHSARELEPSCHFRKAARLTLVAVRRKIVYTI